MAIVIYNVCCNKVNKWTTMCFTDSIIGHFHTFNYNTFLLFNPRLLPFHISIFFWKRKQIKLNKISLSHLAPLPTVYYNTWFKKTGQLDIQTVHPFISWEYLTFWFIITLRAWLLANLLLVMLFTEQKNTSQTSWNQI